MKKSLKINILLGFMLIWGVITGRFLPQWEEFSKISRGWSVIMYFAVILLGCGVIVYSKKILEGKMRWKVW